MEHTDHFKSFLIHFYNHIEFRQDEQDEQDKNRPALFQSRPSSNTLFNHGIFTEKEHGMKKSTKEPIRGSVLIIFVSP